jgi:hypothetical protein
MATPYIPTKDADLLTWAQNFSTLITASPTTYGLIAGDATAIAAAVAPYETAYPIAVNPATRTSVTVGAKDTAKFAMLGVLRSYAQIIGANPAVDSADKLALGLNLHGTPPSPVPVPTTMPLLSVVSATPLLHTLRFADELTPDKRSKPDGVSGMELYRTIAVSAASDPDAANYYALVTRQPFTISFDAGDAGKVCTYFARWINRKGERGPWSAASAFGVVGS